MRKHRYPRRYGHGHVNVANVTNNVINVTQVVQAESPALRRSECRHGRKGLRDKAERKPELLRYCASGGLLEGGKVVRMSDGEMVDEAISVCKYAANGIGSNVRQMGACARGMAGDACDLAGGVWRLGKDVASLFGAIFG